MHKQQGWPQAWEYCQAKPIQTLVRASQGVDWSCSQCIKSHHAQTSSGKGLPSHLWNRNIVRSILPGLWRKRTGLLLSGPKSSFHMKVNFAFHLEVKVWSLEEEWRGTESKLLEVQCEVSTVSDDLGCRDVCWHWSIVFYQVQSQCSRLPGDFRALYASRIDFKVLLLVYKSLNGLGPKYIADMLTEYKPNRPLRSLGSSQLEIPRVHTKQGESAFSYYAARSWNQLPEEIRCAKTLATFKSSLKTHLFSCAFVEWALCYVWTDCIVFYV